MAPRALGSVVPMATRAALAASGASAQGQGLDGYRAAGTADLPASRMLIIHRRSWLRGSSTTTALVRAICEVLAGVLNMTEKTCPSRWVDRTRAVVAP